MKITKKTTAIKNAFVKTNIFFKIVHTFANQSENKNEKKFEDSQRSETNHNEIFENL